MGGALILSEPFYAPGDITAARMRLLPMRFTIMDKFWSAEALNDLSVPLAEGRKQSVFSKVAGIYSWVLCGLEDVLGVLTGE